MVSLGSHLLSSIETFHSHFPSSWDNSLETLLVKSDPGSPDWPDLRLTCEYCPGRNAGESHLLTFLLLRVHFLSHLVPQSLSFSPLSQNLSSYTNRERWEQRQTKVENLFLPLPEYFCHTFAISSLILLRFSLGLFPSASASHRGKRNSRKKMDCFTK